MQFTAAEFCDRSNGYMFQSYKTHKEQRKRNSTYTVKQFTFHNVKVSVSIYPEIPDKNETSPVVYAYLLEYKSKSKGGQVTLPHIHLKHKFQRKDLQGGSQKDSCNLYPTSGLIWKE